MAPKRHVASGTEAVTETSRVTRALHNVYVWVDDEELGDAVRVASELSGDDNMEVMVSPDRPRSAIKL